MSGTLSGTLTGASSHGLDSATDDRSRRRLASRRRAAAREQRRAVHGGRARRRLRDARRSVRSTSPSGSGTRSCGSSGCRSTRPTPRCSTRRPASRGRRGSPAVDCNAATMCRRPPGDADRAARSIWEGEDGDDPHAHLRASCARSPIASPPGSRRGACGEGDAVGLFLPMVPETVAALFAVAKLGAIFLPIFSGYGADAVAVRLAGRAARSRSSPPTASRGAARSCR